MATFVLHHVKPSEDQIGFINSGDSDEIGSVLVETMLQGQVAPAMEQNLYRPVAALRCEDLEELFFSSNHIEHDWRENASVLVAEPEVRSTSVGDIAFDLDSRAAWSCAIRGWEPITDPRYLATLEENSRRYMRALHHARESA